MQVNGKAVKPNEEVLVLPRTDGQIVFKARGVTDITEFDKLVPLPKPPNMFRRERGRSVPVPNLEDPVYKAKLVKYSQLMHNWTILKALEATEGLKWDTVDMTDPETWGNYVNDLRQGFSDTEIVRIMNLAADVNALNDARLEEARARFLTDQQEPQNGQNFQKEEQSNTPSGEPAKESASRIPAMNK